MKKLLHKPIRDKEFDDFEFRGLALDTTSRLLTQLSRVYQNEIRRNEKRLRAHDKRGHYTYIARITEDILSMLIPIRQHFDRMRKAPSRIKFLDCGCGIGNVVLLARGLGFDAYGIEYDKETLAYGKNLFKKLGQDPARLFQGDLLEFDGFDEYDVLYLYCPMVDSRKQRIFQDRLLIGAKVGALITGCSYQNFNHLASKKKAIITQTLMLYSQRGEYSYSNPVLKAQELNL